MPTITFSQDVHPFVEVMLTHRKDFGKDNLETAFLLYSQLRENSSEPLNSEESFEEFDKKFLEVVESKGVTRYYHMMLKYYCRSRFVTPVKVVDTKSSYNRMVSEMADRSVDDIKAMIRRMRCQKDRLNLSSLKFSDVEYEIHDEYMEMCHSDMILLLQHADPLCDPKTDDACIPSNDRPGVRTEDD